MSRSVSVHLAPSLVAPERFAGSIAVVADILRATTTMIHALAAGASTIYPCLTLDDARDLASSLQAPLLAGERNGIPIPGFELGNSPDEMTPDRCRGRQLVMTTTNGTRALLHAALGERTLIGAFVNLRATCELLLGESRPVHILCAGESGGVALEDTLFAGAAVATLLTRGEWHLDDGANLVEQLFRHNPEPASILHQSVGGVRLRSLGYHEDIRAAARVDVFGFAAELRPGPWRVEIVQPSAG